MTSEAVALFVTLSTLNVVLLVSNAWLLRLLREVTLLASSRTTTEAANYRRVQKTPKRRDDDDLTERELLDPTTRGV